MIEELLAREEGKTLEFKESGKSLQNIIHTVIAFANTAGGILVIGVKNKTKEVIGIKDVFLEEERIANAISDSIAPAFYPNIQIITWRNRDLLLVNVNHSFGPYHMKSKGAMEGTYVRFGSTNRLADQEILSEIQWAKTRKYFDEIPNFECPVEQVDFELATKLFRRVNRDFSENSAAGLKLLVLHQNKYHPSNGAVILFARNPQNYFAGALIRLVRFKGYNKTEVIDFQDLSIPMVQVLDPIMDFIRRHTNMEAIIEAPMRKEMPQYHPTIVKEAIINAVLHSDYSIKGINIQVAIFDDRIEITNPGGLPIGLSLESAVSGISQIRNHVIARVFRELQLAEQWGSGLNRMLKISEENSLTPPKFEEQKNFFRITLYHGKIIKTTLGPWENIVFDYLKENTTISPKIAKELWKVSDKTASNRLKRLCEQGKIKEFSTGPFDPFKLYKLS